jgi:hypothetical protein
MRKSILVNENQQNLQNSVTSSHYIYEYSQSSFSTVKIDINRLITKNIFKNDLFLYPR